MRKPTSRRQRSEAAKLKTFFKTRIDGPFGIWVFPKIMVPPNHPILIGFSIVNHPFWGINIFGNTNFFLIFL